MNWLTTTGTILQLAPTILQLIPQIEQLVGKGQGEHKKALLMAALPNSLPASVMIEASNFIDTSVSLLNKTRALPPVASTTPVVDEPKT